MKSSFPSNPVLLRLATVKRTFCFGVWGTSYFGDLQTSITGPDKLAELLARSGIAGPVVLVGESIAGFNVRMFASDHPERAAGLVLVDASHEDDAHEVPGMARFVPLLSTIGALRLLGVTFGQPIESLAPSVRRFARATMFRASGYQAAADEIIHIRETVSEVKSSRRTLTIPVLVVTGARGADQNWRRLQQDEASLSKRGCLVTAEQSGHVVAIDQPEIVVEAIRTVGRDGQRPRRPALRHSRCERWRRPSAKITLSASD